MAADFETKIAKRTGRSVNDDLGYFTYGTGLRGKLSIRLNIGHFYETDIYKAFIKYLEFKRLSFFRFWVCKFLLKVHISFEIFIIQDFLAQSMKFNDYEAILYIYNTFFLFKFMSFI